MKINEIEQIIEAVTEAVLKKLATTAQQKQLAVAFLNQADGHDNFDKKEIQTIAEIVSYDDVRAQGLFVNYLSLQQLVAISNLQHIDHATQVINQFLLAGKTVWVKTAEINLTALRKHAKYRLYQRFADVYERCQSFGIEFKFSLADLQQLQRKQKEGKFSSTDVQQKYLTEKDVQKLLSEDSKVNFDDKKLTPLAKDFLLEQKNKNKGG